jgi:hypothetical protein
MSDKANNGLGSVDEWDSYARLVLTELERHNDLLFKINEKLDAIKLQQALYEQDIKRVKVEVADHGAEILDLKKRVYKLEQGELLESTIKKYRSWIIAGAFGVITSVALPAISIFVKIWG